MNDIPVWLASALVYAVPAIAVFLVFDRYVRGLIRDRRIDRAFRDRRDWEADMNFVWKLDVDPPQGPNRFERGTWSP